MRWGACAGESSDSAGLMRRCLRWSLLCGLLLLAGCATHSSLSPGMRYPQSDMHIVRRGDTLFSIAWKNGLDYQTVAVWNRIRPPYTIYVGQRIRLRPPEAGPRRGESPSAPALSRIPPPSTGAYPHNSTNTSLPVPDSAAMPAWQWPASGPILRRFDAEASGKKGISIGGTHGSQVRAAAAGQVVYAGSGLVGYGRLIIIKHNDIYLSAYGHNRHLLVNEGDAVRSGQVVAEMGSSGTNRIQLHFEIRRKGKPVDPLRYLPRR